MDIDDQDANNYEYDGIGNLVRDAQEKLAEIRWTNSGKIRTILGEDGHADLEFHYDAMSNRILKVWKPKGDDPNQLAPETSWKYTYYVRDASGTVLAIYDRFYEPTEDAEVFHERFILAEAPVYGSSRLGSYRPERGVASAQWRLSDVNPATGLYNNRDLEGLDVAQFAPGEQVLSRIAGEKSYELTNHLGNVLSVVSDKKVYDRDWQADLQSSQDYYAFGMQMPGRSYNSDAYRFGFNGQENDNEVKGTGNHQAFGDYGYDPRLGKRWDIDPRSKEYPNQSPYSAFNNNPILYNDPTGESGEATIDKQSRTITVNMRIVIYGDRANKHLAATTARDIQRAYNEANGKVVIDKVSYNVRFSVVGEYKVDDNNLKNEIISNADYKNNYFRVGLVTNRPSNASHVDPNIDGGVESNTGEFNYNEIKANNSTTEGHEIGHGIGLEHNNKTGWNIEIIGQPDIMDTRGNKVESQYALPDGEYLDFSKRKVTQKNIDNIFKKDVVNQLKETNKVNLGKLTNQYHEKPKK